MKLLFINQYYWPDHASTAQHLSDLCEHLAHHGHEVHVLCSRGQYDPNPQSTTPDFLSVKSEIRNQKSEILPALSPGHETHRGVHIHRVRATGFGKRRLVGRIIDYATFHMAVGLRTLLTAGRYDAIVTLTTPPLIGIYATLIRLIRPRTGHLCWVMDLHPDIEFELGVLRRTSLTGRVLEWLNATHFRRADACIALGPYMAQRLAAKGVAPKNIATIPVWGLDTPSEAHSELLPNQKFEIRSQKSSLGLQDKFVVMYSGNAGLIHTFDAITQAALLLRDDPRLVFLFVGGGKRIAEIADFQRKHQLANIRIMPYVPREMLHLWLAVGDAHLVSLRDSMAGVAVPSKVYGIFAAGRPALFVGPELSEAAQAIKNAGAGSTFATSASADLARYITRLADDPTLGQTMGMNARAAFARQFNRTVCCQVWRELIERCVKPR